MSGNFDLPAASDRNNQPRNPADRAQYRMRLNTRLHHLQNLLDARMSHWSDPVREYTYNVLRRELQALDDVADRRAEADATDTGERIGFERGSPAENPVPATTRSGAVLDRYSSTTGQRRSRVDAVDRLNVIMGPRDGDNRINADHSELDSQDVSRHVFRDLGSLWDLPRVLPLKARHGRWRHKRRKLDSDDKREGICRFRYGHYGEVVPGTLEMEIVSCDGGTYEASGENSYPENVLLNDSSVYCTKNDRCNLILRHHGETPFCLQKIVIKAPKSGFDAPIQEGMIFVSMALDEFLERTAQYQIVYSSSPLRPRRRRHPRGSFSHRYLSSARSPLRSLERPAVSGPGTWSDSENELTPSSFDSRPIVYRSSSSDFRITTHFDDKSDDDINDEDPDEAPSSTDVDRMRMDQIESEMRCPDLDVDSDEASEWINGLLNGEQRQFRRRMRRAVNDIEAIGSLDGGRSRRLVPSLIEPSSTFRNRGALTDGSEPTASDPEIMKPHARFFIKKEKSMVSIKFDPPVSGKFILIKLWSPFSGGNIDIQSVVVHGFAGPRFFPSMRLR
ncbi:predicted protein [Histoplasma mississippiense (nom. inval.)]|uniref:predicted protein n=1 Tax=Ajellomyces capsulatus (strain NAm1 / WU24) TaxID=2059318 RepID=UPI000157D257|nr:predicted protein [Histoplasma mississippiense (nom. inval.)]EDN04730.1 predicted protein [Histoplasma mississippiense (nom. inval.)]